MRRRQRPRDRADAPPELLRYRARDWTHPELDPPPPSHVVVFAEGTLPVTTLEQRLASYHEYHALRRWTDARAAWEAEHGPLPEECD